MVAGSCHQMHMLNFQQHTLDCICYAMCVVRSAAFVAPARPFGVVSVRRESRRRTAVPRSVGCSVYLFQTVVGVPRCSRTRHSVAHSTQRLHFRLLFITTVRSGARVGRAPVAPWLVRADRREPPPGAER